MERSAWRARRRRRRAGVLLVAAAAVAVLAVVAADLPQRGDGEPQEAAGPGPAPDTAATAGPAPTTGPQQPVNGGFDNGMSGWEATPGAVVSWQASGHVGGSALVRANPEGDTPEIAPVTSTIDADVRVVGLVARDAAPSGGAGTSLQGSVWVRGAAGATVLVRLTEHAGDEEVADSRQEVELGSEDWEQVTVTHAVTQEDTRVDLEVLAVDPQPGDALGIDSASVTVAT